MKKFFLFAATLLGLVACNKNEADINVPARQITIHATADMNNGSDASGPHRIAPNDITASSVSFHWEEGDQIWVVSNDFSEKQLFTIDASTINGNQADFTGTALSDMSSYHAMYSDNDNVVIEDIIGATLGGKNSISLNYNPDSKNWIFCGLGTENNFTLGCTPSLRMQLKGSCKLGKVTFLPWNSESGDSFNPQTTLNFVHGSFEGLQLTSTAVDVVMPLCSYTTFGFTLLFYDTDGIQIDKKSKAGKSLYDALEATPLVNLGVIEVAEPFVPTYVDLGLPSGLKWATCNVGATAPEGYGDYFAWGETEPKDVYDWSTYKWCNGSYDTQTKYCTSSSYGTVDNKTTLEPEDDAAYVNWGGNWRMPTYAELDELKTKCTWTPTTLNSISGYEVKGPNNNTIFLPASGDCSLLYSVGSDGYYWSSSLDEYSSSLAYSLLFGSDLDWGNFYRYRGLPVRPVCE